MHVVAVAVCEEPQLEVHLITAIDLEAVDPRCKEVTEALLEDPRDRRIRQVDRLVRTEAVEAVFADRGRDRRRY